MPKHLFRRKNSQYRPNQPKIGSITDLPPRIEVVQNTSTARKLQCLRAFFIFSIPISYKQYQLFQDLYGDLQGDLIFKVSKRTQLVVYQSIPVNSFCIDVISFDSFFAVSRDRFKELDLITAKMKCNAKCQEAVLAPSCIRLLLVKYRNAAGLIP